MRKLKQETYHLRQKEDKKFQTMWNTPTWYKVIFPLKYASAVSSPHEEIISVTTYCSRFSAAGNTDTTSSVRCSTPSRKGFWQINTLSESPVVKIVFIMPWRNEFYHLRTSISIPTCFHKVYEEEMLQKQLLVDTTDIKSA